MWGHGLAFNTTTPALYYDVMEVTREYLGEKCEVAADVKKVEDEEMTNNGM